VFPSVNIPGYMGTPTPVIDCERGELVAVLTSCSSWDIENPNPPISIIPNDSTVGIKTCDPNYDIVLGGVFILNTGFDYCNPTVLIWDRDREDYNGEVEVTTLDGRIVEVTVKDSGRDFFRLPRVDIIDTGEPCGTQGGYGAKLVPIMNVIPKADAKPLPATVNNIYCPGKNHLNLTEPETPEAVLNRAFRNINTNRDSPIDSPLNALEVAAGVSTSQQQAAAAAELAQDYTQPSSSSSSSSQQQSSSQQDDSSSNQQQQSGGGYGGY
jgi:hypothetical protein